MLRHEPRYKRCAWIPMFVPDPCRLSNPCSSLHLSCRTRVTLNVVPLPLPLLFRDLLFGAEPVLYILAGSTITAFIELIRPLSYFVLQWDSACHHGYLGGRAFRAD